MGAALGLSFLTCSVVAQAVLPPGEVCTQQLGHSVASIGTCQSPSGPGVTIVTAARVGGRVVQTYLIISVTGVRPLAAAPPQNMGFQGMGTEGSFVQGP